MALVLRCTGCGGMRCLSPRSRAGCRQGCMPVRSILPKTGLSARTGMGLLSLAGTGCGGELFGEVWTKAVCGGTGLGGWHRCAGRGAKQCPHQGFGGVSIMAGCWGPCAAVSPSSGAGCCPCRPLSHPGERQECSSGGIGIRLAVGMLCSTAVGNHVPSCKTQLDPTVIPVAGWGGGGALRRSKVLE